MIAIEDLPVRTKEVGTGNGIIRICKGKMFLH